MEETEATKAVEKNSQVQPDVLQFLSGVIMS